ncbi:SF0329 family protein [Cypionkella sp. TWP1-2-1b2]|uniref:SF0329 family protein n=1 Tax=Cypionkella sp. TWP1-2-1b2 TaxID=2804675 RepID=UPI003CED7077
MRWSKVKQLAEGNFAPELGSRVRLNLTVLRATHDAEQRGTITVDGEVWLNACYFNHVMAGWDLMRDKHLSQDEAAAVLDKQGLVAGWQFPREIFDYLNISVDGALATGRTVKTILAVLDRRVGKRRFREIADRFKSHTVIARFVKLRLEASEGNRLVAVPKPQANA